MIPEFEELSQAEIELMHKAPILVCILIAGSDDHIDNREIKKALLSETCSTLPLKIKLLSGFLSPMLFSSEKTNWTNNNVNSVNFDFNFIGLKLEIVIVKIIFFY